MNLTLKIVLIFGLVYAAIAQDRSRALGFFADLSATEGSGTDETTTPEASDGSSTAFTGSTVTTTQASEGSSTAFTGSTVTTTQASEGSSTAFTGSTGSTVTTTQGPCAASPCIGDSSCEERLEGLFVCVCRPGLVYNNNTGCAQAKVFPGDLKLSSDFNEKMSDKTSKEFKETAAKLEKELGLALKNLDGYLRSVVLSLRRGSIVAEVQNLFDLTSTVTSEKCQETIQEAIDNKIFGENTVFQPQTVCEIGTCDGTTTDCNEKVSGVATCTCREGYVQSQSTSQLCLACPNGERAVGTDKCEKCPFGFAGFNCNDPYLLVVVVVSTVLGAFLIIVIVALIVVSCRKQKESSSPKVDFSSSYGNMELHKPTGVPRIPRANPDASWKSNDLEITKSNQALVTRDRPESKARYSDYEEDVSYRGQVPPAYSGYDGRRVQNGGVQNPYFRQDDDRMRRY